MEFGWAERAKLRNERYLMRVLNKKYWPYQVEVKDVDKAERWCYERLPSKNWRNVNSYFAFKNAEDATMFTLSCT